VFMTFSCLLLFDVVRESSSAAVDGREVAPELILVASVTQLHLVTYGYRRLQFPTGNLLCCRLRGGLSP